MPDDSQKKQSPTSEISIPQIVLTEPPSQSSELIATGSSHVIDMSESMSKNTLTPPSFKKSKNSPPSPDPLPLTQDLLKRKNKLDKLLLQKEKQTPTVDYFSHKVDERVTAGLGISTPTPQRTRQMSSSSISNRSEPEKSSPFQFEGDWSYDLEAYKSTTSGSSLKRKHTTNGTSVSGSSIRNSVSMRAYSANHRYMDHTRDEHYHFTRPNQPKRQKKEKSRFFLLDILYQAAIRCVNSRAPECKQVADNERFDFSSPTTYLQPDTIFDEKIDTKSIQDTPNTPNNNNDASHILPFRNRLSWLSFQSSEDRSLYTLEKKVSYISNIYEPPPPPPPQLFTSPPPPPISLSDEIVHDPLQGHSLFIFSPNNAIRIFVWKFIRSR